MGELIYLDYNATTPVDPRVFERMTIFLQEKWGNHKERGRIVTTTIEHPATEEPCAHLERNGWTRFR